MNTVAVELEQVVNGVNVGHVHELVTNIQGKPELVFFNGRLEHKM